MQAHLRVRRFDPEEPAPQPRYQDYTVEAEDYFTVLDALIKIREEEDGTLAVRCSCRSSVCGSCAMRINGHATLACKTKLTDASKGRDVVLVEPMGNMPVVKDLVTDLQSFWDKVWAVEPFLQPQGPVPEQEYLASNESMVHLTGVMNCIMCGACVSDCTVLAVDPNFLAPAALAKAYRFVADPRDGASKERLRALSQYGGIWDCTRCLECVQVCPKDVAPMDRIMTLRDKAMQAGYTSTYGARHTIAFSELLKESGRLDELRLPVMTFGIFNLPRMLSLVPVGLRALVRGKMPPIFHRAIPGVEHIRRSFRSAEAKR
ncbi:MAG: succinate dehydrogenase iron-sulfur subunit [Chloroflexi bacterium]|nr:succinate dehydrogenase iron-sulfur subunit [Chloroflexota bacterium]